MAESFSPDQLPNDKAERYLALLDEIRAVIEGEPNRIARLATVTSMVGAAIDGVSWVGFYLVDPDTPGELVIGPYQGPLGCLRIRFGRGVCGAAAAQRQTQIVPDVEAFADHIACDALTRSEIVVPVFDRQSNLIGVLDLDSHRPAMFDEIDHAGLKAIVDWAFGQGEPARAR